MQGRSENINNQPHKNQLEMREIRKASTLVRGMEETKILWCWNCEQYVMAVKVHLGWECSRCGVMVG